MGTTTTGGGSSTSDTGVVTSGGQKSTDWMNGFLGIGGSETGAKFYDTTGTQSYQDQLAKQNALYNNYQGVGQYTEDPRMQQGLNQYAQNATLAAQQQALQQSRLLGDQYGPGGAGYAAAAQGAEGARYQALADIANKQMGLGQFADTQRFNYANADAGNRANLLGKQSDMWAGMYKDANIVTPGSTTGNKK